MQKLPTRNLITTVYSEKGRGFCTQINENGRMLFFKDFAAEKDVNYQQGSNSELPSVTDVLTDLAEKFSIDRFELLSGDGDYEETAQFYKNYCRDDRLMVKHYSETKSVLSFGDPKSDAQDCVLRHDISDLVPAHEYHITGTNREFFQTLLNTCPIASFSSEQDHYTVKLPMEVDEFHSFLQRNEHLQAVLSPKSDLTLTEADLENLSDDENLNL